MARVFLTGASGFIGRATTRALCARGHAVTGLMRATPVPQGVTAVTGDLLDPATWRPAMERADVVVHLAARTGRARAPEHARVNAEGTRLLAEACAATGRPLLLVSTVAVQYPNLGRYPYAAAKRDAEAAARASGARHLVARPTIVAGPGSPVVAGLARLAALPIVPVFGDGAARVQPVDVDDVAEVLADLVDQGSYDGTVVGIGGPEIIPVEGLLQAIRAAAGKAPARALHLPWHLTLPLVAGLEAVTGGRFPLTVGQLSLFRFDGTVAPHPLVEVRRPSMRPLDAMLRRSLA